MSEKEWHLLLLQTGTIAISFVIAALMGGAGWTQRTTNRTKLGFAIVSANCGAVGFLGAGLLLVTYPEAYLQAFMTGASIGWITGRYGLKRLPEILGLLMRELSALRDELTKK